MNFNWFSKKKKTLQVANHAADVDPLQLPRGLILSITREQQVQRLKMRTAAADKRRAALQNDANALKAASERFRETVAQAVRGGPGDETSAWMEQGCPTQSAVTVMRPLRLTSKTGFGFVGG